jgi:hypothetical protein
MKAILGKLQDPEYHQVKCYNGISVRLQTYSINVVEYHPMFLNGVARIHQFL